MPYPADWSLILVVLLKNPRKIGFPLEIDFCLRCRLTCCCDPMALPEPILFAPTVKWSTALLVKHHTKIRFFSSSGQAIAKKCFLKKGEKK